MKLLAFIGWATLALPVLLILAKLIGLITSPWVLVLLIATGIPVAMAIGFLLLAIYIIKQYPDDYWRR